MFIERLSLTLTVNASGDATVYSDKPVDGRVLQLRYVPDATVPLDIGADLTITGEDTGVAIATLTNIGTSGLTVVPRQATHTTAGAAALYAAAGVAVLEAVYVAGERLKVVVAQGGTSKTGTLHVCIG
jgi:hypothetical protein